MSREARSARTLAAQVPGYQPTFKVDPGRRLTLTFANDGPVAICIPRMYLHPEGELGRSILHIYNEEGDEWENLTLEIPGDPGRVRLRPGQRFSLTFTFNERYRPPESGDSVGNVKWIGLAYRC